MEKNQQVEREEVVFNKIRSLVLGTMAGIIEYPDSNNTFTTWVHYVEKLAKVKD